jgi:feruloyl esterase
VGNGGWAGAINVGGLVEPLRRGYAVAGTDDGHSGSMGAGASWAIGHPEKLVDFGYRAVHETSVQARAIARAFYGKEPGRSYFIGCSDGGREGLMEAQRYPEEFDGIIAGAPAAAWSHLTAEGAWNQQALRQQPIPAAKLPAIQRAALAACDARDGVKDGLVEDPRACRFDPAVLTCRGADGPDCLTRAQVATLRKLYEGPRDPRTGASFFPGFPPGTEAVQGGWSPWIIGDAGRGAIESFFADSYFGQAVYEDAAWDPRTFDLARDVPLADRKVGSVLDATNPDLRSFRAHGGKLIQYHGWGDAAIPPLSSIDYYESVRAFLDRFPDPRTPRRGPIQDFYRLFMVPGMGHCGGGIGPRDLGQGPAPASAEPERNVFSALEQWAEHGVAPEQIVGSGTVAGDTSKHLTRPLCPYPRVARYKGSGDIYDAGSFSCAVPEKP